MLCPVTSLPSNALLVDVHTHLNCEFVGSTATINYLRKCVNYYVSLIEISLLGNDVKAP